jgi:hypothetical protein
MTFDLHDNGPGKKPLICRWHRSADGPIKCTWTHAASGTPTRPSYLSGSPLEHNSDGARHLARGTRAFVGIAWTIRALPTVLLGFFLRG